jgi:Pyruvate/2-oxoacid:ferredoxin oxidoreductase delta subunit
LTKQRLTRCEDIRKQTDGFHVIYPSLSRDTCTDILKVIVYSNEDVILADESDFEKDELFCEGVYTLNYQTREFVSTYGGKTVRFAFDQLPTVENYLKSFEEELTSVQLFDTIDV